MVNPRRLPIHRTWRVILLPLEVPSHSGASFRAARPVLLLPFPCLHLVSRDAPSAGLLSLGLQLGSSLSYPGWAFSVCDPGWAVFCGACDLQLRLGCACVDGYFRVGFVRVTPGWAHIRHRAFSICWVRRRLWCLLAVAVKRCE